MGDKDYTIISPGIYEDLCQCDYCGHKFCQYVDGTDEENEQRASHECNGDGFEIVGS